MLRKSQSCTFKVFKRIDISKIFSFIVQTRGKTNKKRGRENYWGDIAGFETNSETFQSSLHLDKMFPRVLSSWWGTDNLVCKVLKIHVPIFSEHGIFRPYPLPAGGGTVAHPGHEYGNQGRVTSFCWWWWLSINPVKYFDLSFLNVTVTSDNSLFRILNVSTVDGWQWWGREDGLKPYHSIDLNTREEAWSRILKWPQLS